MRFPLPIVPLVIGAVGLFWLIAYGGRSAISNNRLQAMRAVDVVLLIGSVACVIVALVLLMRSSS